MQMGKQIILIGCVTIVVGIIWLLFAKHFQWLGHLPGDFKWKKGNSIIYLPIASMVLISVAINIIMWIVKWLSK